VTYTNLSKTVDEETKAEFAEIQKQGPLGIGGASGGAGQNTAQQIQNFDLAGWMAGKK
jgi:succinyl-CoA synthetase alpha subunit